MRRSAHPPRRLLTAALLCAWPAAAQSQTTFTASVDRTQVSMNDQLVLTLSVSGQGVRSAQPQLPNLKAFNVGGRSTSQQIQFINGRMSYNIRYQYTLVPLRAGTHTIGAATLTVGNQVYHTKPITITVTAGTTQPPAQTQPSAPSQPSGAPAQMPPGYSADQPGGNVFLRATVDKQTAYVNEQITLDISAYRRIRWYNAQGTPPALNGFVAYDLPKAESQYETVDGVQYVRDYWIRKALFPTAAGEVTLGKASIQFSSTWMGGRTYEVRSQPLTLKVLPLPEEGKPAGFTGAVGQFALTATVDHAQVDTNQPVTLTATVTGTGNLATVAELDLGDLTHLKQFKSNQSENMQTQGVKLAGTKTFEIVLMPLEPGIVALGPIRLPYFNPATKRYETASAGPLQLTVTRGAADQAVDTVTGFTKDEIRLLKKDIHYVRGDAKRLSRSAGRLHRQPWFLLVNGLALVALAVSTCWRRREQRLSADADYQRRRRGDELAQQALAEAQRELSRGMAAEFYRALSAGLREFLASRLAVPASAISADTTPAALESAGVSTELIARLRACLEQSEAGRFAPGATELEVMRVALDNARACLAELADVEVRSA